jgi:four helix bundle protein
LRDAIVETFSAQFHSSAGPQRVKLRDAIVEDAQRAISHTLDPGRFRFRFRFSTATSASLRFVRGERSDHSENPVWRETFSVSGRRRDNGGMQAYKDLKVWQRAHRLVVDVYRVTVDFPSEERFGLTNQVRRAAASVPTNIVEGSKRRHANDDARFLNVAEGSAAETEYLLLLGRDLAFASAAHVDPLRAECIEIERMLHALRERVARTS